jgi:hypothetical protein
MIKKKNPEKKYHFFGSTCTDWAVGQTEAEVLGALGRRAGANTIRQQVAANGGMYAWLCVVGVPQSARYRISGYAPNHVPWCQSREYRIQNTKGHVLPEPNTDGETS